MDSLSIPYDDHPWLKNAYIRDPAVYKLINHQNLFKDVDMGSFVVATVYRSLLDVLGAYSIDEVIRRNAHTGHIACIKRPNVTALLVDKHDKLMLDPNGKLLIGTNRILPTEENEFGQHCPRIQANLDSTSDKAICALSCAHEGCAEKQVIEEAHKLGLHINGSKIILFGHTQGPCSICSELMITHGVRCAIIGSPPPVEGHKDYDPLYTETGYKLIMVSTNTHNNDE